MGSFNKGWEQSKKKRWMGEGGELNRIWKKDNQYRASLQKGGYERLHGLVEISRQQREGSLLILVQHTLKILV